MSRTAKLLVIAALQALPLVALLVFRAAWPLYLVWAGISALCLANAALGEPNNASPPNNASLNTKGELLEWPLNVYDTSWQSIRYLGTTGGFCVIADGEFSVWGDAPSHFAYVSVDGQTVIGKLKK